MTRSSRTFDSTLPKTPLLRNRLMPEGGERAAAGDTGAAELTTRGNQEPESKGDLAAAWNEALCCEARNSLQVILSGAEILLEDHLENLLSGQKQLLSKMSDNAYHLCNLLSALLGPEEFKLEQTHEGRFRSTRRTPAKV